MITEKQTLHEFNYRGSVVTISHCIFVNNPYPMSHYEIQAVPAVPLPMTETGYKSLFMPYYDQDLDGLKKSSASWKAECTHEIQPSLF